MNRHKMSKQTRPFNVVIQDEHGLKKAQHVINNLKVTPGCPLEVVIRPYKASRSQQQNALYWKWLTIIADEIGDTKDALHEQMKRRFLKPILEREDEGFADIMNNLRQAYRDGHKKLAQQIEVSVMLEVTTSRLNVSQMTEYLESILDHARSMDISLPIPPDRRRL